MTHNHCRHNFIKTAELFDSEEHNGKQLMKLYMTCQNCEYQQLVPPTIPVDEKSIEWFKKTGVIFSTPKVAEASAC